MKRFNEFPNPWDLSRKPPQWETSLSEFLGAYAGRERFGFRASCLEHWAYQYLEDDMATTDPCYPSRVKRNAILEAHGFLSKVIYIKGDKESARVFYRGEGFSGEDLFVFVKDRWVSEAEFRTMDESFSYITTRKEAASKYAKTQIEARSRARKAELKARENEELANYEELESVALDQIRLALTRQRKGAQRYGAGSLLLELRQEQESHKALARWRRHYKLTGESMSGDEAILPKRHDRRPRAVQQEPKPAAPRPIYQFQPQAPQEPPQIVSEPYQAPTVYQAPSVLSYGDEPLSDYHAPSVLSYGDEPQAPITESSANDTPVESSREARIAEAQRILNDPRSSVEERLRAGADFEKALFAPDGDSDSPHNMSMKMARGGKRSLYEQDRQEGERILGINKTQPVSLAPWAIMLGDWLERAEREVWETQPLLTNGVRSTAAPMFCIPASSLRLAVDKHFGEKTVSPKKLGAFMRERGFGAGNKMWRQGAIRVFYKNCAGPADPQRMIVCNVNDDGRSVTWGMERGAVLAAQI